MEILRIAGICGGISSIITLCAILIRPLRERLIGTKAIRDGQRCLLRSDMLRTYYKNHEDDRIRQYEFENFVMEYAAYKALGGNSFMDHVYDEVKKWEVET